MSQQITVEAPRHRFYSVLGLLLQLRVPVLNRDELDLAIFTREPLRFLCETNDPKAVVTGVEQLKEEFGEDFSVHGAD